MALFTAAPFLTCATRVMVLCRHKRGGRRKGGSGGKAGEAKEKASRLLRGTGVAIKKITDKKLKGKLRHAERVYKEAQKKAIQANEWLLPAEAGYLEAEGGCGWK